MTAEPVEARGASDVLTRGFWRALIQFEPQKIVTAIAIRNTLAFTCAVILGTIFSSPSTGVVAGLGALNVCYSDGTDPDQYRARRMLIATRLLGSAVEFRAHSAHSNVAAITIATLGAFAAGMAVALCVLPPPISIAWSLW